MSMSRISGYPTSLIFFSTRGSLLIVCGGLSILLMISPIVGMRFCRNSTGEKSGNVRLAGIKMADYSSSSSSEAEFEEEALLLMLLLRRRRRRRFRANARKLWARPWILRRSRQGVFSNLIQELDCEDPAKFRQYHRLDREQFEEVSARVGPVIGKEDTNMRLCISAGERLSITLRFLATGTVTLLNFLSLGYQVYLATFCIVKSSCFCSKKNTAFLGCATVN